MQKFEVYKSAQKIDTIWAYDAQEAAKTFGLTDPTFCDGVAFQWFSEDDGSYAIEIMPVAEE